LGPGPDGWVAVNSRRRQRRSPPARRRPVPADPVGKCFNWFSPEHTAALCRLKISVHVLPRNGSPAGEAPMAAADGQGPPTNEDGARRPRRLRFRQPGVHGSTTIDTPAQTVNPGPRFSASAANSEATTRVQMPPPCIINWSDRVTRAEEDLTSAVIVTVCGSAPLAPAGEVAEVIAARLSLAADSLVLRQSSDSSYLLVLPDVGSVERLVDRRLPPPRSATFSLLCRHWSRFAGASGRVLPCMADRYGSSRHTCPCVGDFSCGVVLDSLCLH